MATAMKTIFVFLVCIVLTLHPSSISLAQQPTPNVPWADFADFELDTDASDEFDSPVLDETKWDVHGLRNPDTDCPRWNGPLSTGVDSIYSTYYSTSTNLENPNGPPHREYDIQNGKFLLNIGVRPESFFAAREYYCDPETFHCNHDQTIPCYWTNLKGEPIIKDGQFVGMTHDKCKMEPYCIPHHHYVLNKPERPYRKYVSTHLYGKPMFRYGFVETKIKMAKSSAVMAVWMHGRDTTGPGWCRFMSNDEGKVVRECPSRVKSDRWEEIDLVEAMHTDFHQRRYIPNVHVFQCSKGEYTSPSAQEDPSGSMGGGPIVINNFVKNQKLFGSIPPEQRVPNSFHMRTGSVYELDEPWGDKERVLGVYWSAQHIRFYVDGVEVLTVANTLVHQPMALDISSQLNVGWAKQEPASDTEVTQYAEIDYVRVWKVFTPDGVDPPAQKPENDAMTRKFNPILYGDELRGVHGIFPDNDGRTVILTEPEDPPTQGQTTASVEGEVEAGEAEFSMETSTRIGYGLDSNWTTADATVRTMAQMFGMEEDTLEIFFSSGNRKVGKSRRKKDLKKEKKLKKERKEKKLLKLKRKLGMKTAGGREGIRGRRLQRRMRRNELLGHAARRDRATMVRREGGKVVYDFLENAAQTYSEYYDPMSPGAAHATYDGNGEEL